MPVVWRTHVSLNVSCRVQGSYKVPEGLTCRADMQGCHGLKTKGRETRPPAGGADWRGLQRTQMTSAESDTNNTNNTYGRESLHAKAPIVKSCLVSPGPTTA